MKKERVIAEYVQATYDLESSLIKIESLCRKVGVLHSKIDFDSLTQDELDLIQSRALKVLQLAQRIEGVNQ